MSRGAPQHLQQIHQQQQIATQKQKQEQGWAQPHSDYKPVGGPVCLLSRLCTSTRKKRKWGGKKEIISENTKTITLRSLYHLKLAPPLIPESGKADLLPSTLLIGTATDLPWVTTSSTTNFPHTRERSETYFFPPRFCASTITNRMLQAGDAEFQSLILLLFNGIWGSQLIGNSPSCNQSMKAMTKTQPTLPPTGDISQ